MRLKSLSQPFIMDEFDTNISMIYGNESSRVMTFVKILLILFNLVCLATGVGLVYSGSSVLTLYSSHSLFTQSQSGVGPTLMVLTGLLVISIASMGIVGTLKENVCMILSFSFILGVIFMFEVSISLTGFVYQTELRGVLSHSMSQAVQDYAEDPMSMRAVDTLQYQLSCCGVENPSDWHPILQKTSLSNNDDVIKANSDVTPFESNSDEIVIKSKSNILSTSDVSTSKSTSDVRSRFITQNVSLTRYPNSCCESWVGSRCDRVHANGCLDRLDRLMRLSGRALCLILLTVAIVQFLGILFACSLGKLIRLQKSEREKLKWEFRNHLLQTRGPTNFETFVREGQMENNKL